MIPWPAYSVIGAMLAGLVVAALIIGTVDERLVPANRYKAALIYYALPAVPVMGVGLLLAQDHWRYDAGPANHCRDTLCRMTVFREADLALLLHQGMAELACFALMAAILGARSVRLGGRIRALLPGAPRMPLLPGFDSAGLADYNPKNFHVDPDTGQSYRIVRRRLDGSLVLDKKTYEERRQDYYDAVHGSYSFMQLLFFFVLLGLIAWGVFVMYPGPLTALIGLMAVLGCMIPVSLLFRSVVSAVSAPVLQARVGPAPVPMAGREDVRAQKAHGRGGRLSPEAMRDALRGDPAGSSQGDANTGSRRAARSQQVYRD